MKTYTLTRGTTPLLISMPHNSSSIPSDIATRMHPYAQGSPDTDWLLNQLYDFAPRLGMGILQPHYSRYVIDLNRPEDDQSLYPGADTTGLVPTSLFDRRPIYLSEQAPEGAEIQERIQKYWRPYHQALQDELARLKAEHGQVLLFEAHSIASVVPRFFDGQLPDLNLGNHGGKSCSPAILKAAEDIAEVSSYSWVSNGRFQGGYITRAYGQPQNGVHTLQLELSQATYLEEETGRWMPGKVIRIQPVLQRLLEACLDAVP